MRCPQCGTILRDGAQVCDTCGANIPPRPLYPPAGGPADPWGASEPFMAGLPDPWDENPSGPGGPSGGPTPRTLGDLFDPNAAPPPPPASPMRAPKQGALGRDASPMMGQPNVRPPVPTSGPAWPDTGGRGGDTPADANLPAWLFEAPQGWQSPAAGATGPTGATGSADPWEPPPLPATPFPPMPSSDNGQGGAWPAAPWGRAPGTPRPFTGRGPATPMRQLGQMGQMGQQSSMGQMAPPAPGWGDIAEPPPPPPVPSWKRPPAPPSAPLGDPWPSMAPPAPAAFGNRRGLGRLSGRLSGRLRGFSVPFSVPFSFPFKLGRGAGFGGGRAARRAPGPRRSVASRRVAGGVPQPAEGPGWHIVTPLNGPSQPAPFSYLSPTTTRRPNRGIAVISNVSRLTFNLLLLGIVVAILAIPISIALSHLAKQHPPIVSTHPTATPRTIPAAPPGYKQLRSAALAINYPATWTHGTFSLTTSVTGTVQGDLYQDGQNASFGIAAIQAIPADSLQSILNTGLLTITPGPTDSYSPLVTPQLGPTLDGVRWQTEEYTFNQVSAKQTLHLHAVALVASRGANTYIIVYQAPDSAFAGLQSQYFAPMLASFRFGS